MKAILTLLLLALASLAIPSSSAALPVQCAAGPTAPGGDTHCEGTVADCDLLVHSYDKEDALNRYKADCGCAAYDNYGRPAFRFDCYTPPPIASAMAAPDLFETHCVADADGVAYCTTVIAGTCSYTTVSNDATASTLACWDTSFGYCSISPFQNPPNLWCENYQPPGDDSASAQAAQPCQSGFGSSWCTVTAGPCRATVYTYTAWGERSANGRCDTDVVDCAFAGGANVVTTTAIGATATCVYGITRCTVSAGVGQFLLPPNPPDAYCALAGPQMAAPAAEVPPEVCQSGIAQTWCDFVVGPCDVRLVPWTAWGDQYVVSDCHFGGGIGPTCHTEAHTQGPLAHQHWCAW